MRLRRTPLLVTAVVTTSVLAVAALVDIGVEHTAQQRVVRAAACRLETSGPVSAELTGTLAGLRVVTGNLGSVHIAAGHVRRYGTDMDIAADLHDLSTDGTISGGTATATIGYDQLQERLAGAQTAAKDMRVGGDGSGLTLTGKVGTLGIPVTVHTRLSTGADSLTVTPSSITVLGQDIPVARLSTVPGAGRLTQQLTPHTVHLPDLPSGVRLVSARPDDKGLTLALDLSRQTAGATAGTKCA